ncbi:dimethyladenosine transferase [Mycobacterium sp. MS1601]|uniref:SRPBCC family protein n=1 Tax=Mycobacterium sp. MS1601 TaxID=1936029 RepID=UPI00097949D8|nr:SRPBCC family protein [Mycobacterium sp. MS1601]AQA03439.1 dimethyladenosine transferase [Mycobacterium sp. MS1601]
MSARQVSRTVEVNAPAADLFALVADPRRHHELDGSATVGSTVTAPAELSLGSRFSTRMKMKGIPYRITSVITALKPTELLEWRHPFGHHWRWEFEEISPTRTRVTETFDYRDTGPVKDRIDFYRRLGFVSANEAGIEATLVRLQDRFA